MPIRLTDAIIGPSRGTAAKAKASFRSRGAQRIGDEDAYVDAVYALCAPDDMPDAAIVCSAADVETGTFSNHWWKTRLNAGSLGVTGWPPDDEKSPTFATGSDAARSHVSHLLLYATGHINRHGLTPADDPRFDAYRAAFGSKAFPVLNDLSGRYAADTSYGATIARRSQVVYGDLPNQGTATPPKEEPPVSDTIVFGRVPHPEYQNRPITKPEGAGQNNLGKRSVKGVVWHRILGSLWGTDGYFRLSSTEALTDYGCGVLAQDGAVNDGLILRWNDPLGYQSGWASGRVIAPYGDGAKFVNKYGVNAVNRDQASIEISGFYQTAVSEKAKRAIAGITAYWADQYRIPWDRFPIAPQDGFSFVRWHNEFTGMAEKECPGGVVMTMTNELIGMVKGILKQYQTAGVQPQPEPQPEPEPIPVSPYPQGMSPELARELYGSVSVSWASEPFTFDINRSECRFWLEYGSQDIPEGGDWSQGNWGELTRVIRRGNRGSGGRVYRWSNGAVYFQEPPETQTGPDETP